MTEHFGQPANPVEANSERHSSRRLASGAELLLADLSAWGDCRFFLLDGIANTLKPGVEKEKNDYFRATFRTYFNGQQETKSSERLISPANEWL
jgi:hypothetical protein